jgi:ornithine cyclodeaminase/alanine dehydrogenase-like protein (mu-crystallin family)
LVTSAINQSLGGASQDFAAAYAIWEKAEAEDAGHSFELLD